MFECVADERESVAATLHALEGVAEREVFAAYGVGEGDIASVLVETGTPAGWFELVTGYAALPRLPAAASVSSSSLATLGEHQSQSLAPHDTKAHIERLRTLYEAGGLTTAQETEDDGSQPDGEDDEGMGDAAASGAHLPIPTETFIEELSQKLEIHPISVYWLLRELRERDDIVCRPKLQRFVSDHFTVTVLWILGHQWPRQIEAREPVPDWAEPSGIIPITDGTGHETLIARMRKRIAADFGLERVSAIEREFEEIMGVSLETWLGRDLFRNHISPFRKRPIAWHLQSIVESANAPKGKAKGAKRRSAPSGRPLSHAWCTIIGLAISFSARCERNTSAR
jgi:hypothetical protein